MPDLAHSLQGRDLGFLRIVAEGWGLELNAPDARQALPQLVSGLQDEQLVVEVIEALPETARAALGKLVASGGRLPWAQFTRRYGSVREMGPGRRDRERPDRSPASTAEMLWYRLLVARAFFDTPGGPEEFAYIPTDLLPMMPADLEGATTPPGRPATAAERAHTIQATDRILDHACSLLAALRLGSDPGELEQLSAGWSMRPQALQALLAAAGLLDEEGIPQPEAARAFLEAPRGTALAMLARAWLESETFNELRLIPHLQAEGEWENDPVRARQTVLDFMSRVPERAWWSLPSFVAAIHQENPDFQRPAGDYDSWFIRDRHSGEFLRGFESWDLVDGELIRFVVHGPLHWLGIVDLAAAETGAVPGAFRKSAWAAALLKGESPRGLPQENAPVHVRSDGEVGVPRLAPRAVRYQIARFGALHAESRDAYRYRLTPASLGRAREQGLRVGPLLALLGRHADAVPPSLVRALQRWESHGVEAHCEQALVLHLARPEMLQALRASRAARFLGDPLGPATVIVRPGAWEKVQAALAELGYLGEMRGEDAP